MQGSGTRPTNQPTGTILALLVAAVIAGCGGAGEGAVDGPAPTSPVSSAIGSGTSPGHTSGGDGSSPVVTAAPAQPAADPHGGPPPVTMPADPFAGFADGRVQATVTIGDTRHDFEEPSLSCYLLDGSLNFSVTGDGLLLSVHLPPLMDDQETDPAAAVVVRASDYSEHWEASEPMALMNLDPSPALARVDRYEVEEGRASGLATFYKARGDDAGTLLGGWFALSCH